MTKHRSVADVKARLSQCIRDAEDGDPVVITRHGDPVAALVRAEDLETLERLRAAGPEGGLASIAGGWDDSEDLVDAVKASPRIGSRESPPVG